MNSVGVGAKSELGRILPKARAGNLPGFLFTFRTPGFGALIGAPTNITGAVGGLCLGVFWFALLMPKRADALLRPYAYTFGSPCSPLLSYSRQSQPYSALSDGSLSLLLGPLPSRAFSFGC